jgi:hypothetical protein
MAAAAERGVKPAEKGASDLRPRKAWVGQAGLLNIHKWEPDFDRIEQVLNGGNFESSAAGKPQRVDVRRV